MSLLEQILAVKRREIEALRALPPPPEPRRERIDVYRALKRPTAGALRLVAEIKFRSPSAGPLSRALDSASRAQAYAEAGASMVSVLCDSEFFDGGFAHLAQARARLDALGAALPVLAKEFVLDEAQVCHARHHGADAVLLIARILDATRLRELVRATSLAGLEPFVEVVDERELDAALAAGARLIGVNARDLDTLAMDRARAARVLDAIPGDCVAIHLSGLKTPEDVRAVAGSRADAALLGETLMRHDDPAALLTSLVEAAER